MNYSVFVKISKIALVAILALVVGFVVSPRKYISIFSAHRNTQETLYRDFLLSQLSPYITQSIQKYYGYPKSYDLFDAKVLNIKRLEKGTLYFEIVIQVMTYEGAHNPPYGIETVTIRQDQSGTYVSNFNHQDYDKRRRK